MPPETATLTAEDEKLLKVAEDFHAAATKREGELAGKLEKKLSDLLDAREKTWQEKFPAWSMPGVEAGQKKEQYSLARAAVGVATKDYTLCPYEFRVSNELKQKAMTFGVDSGGGFLVPTEVMGGLIDLMQAQIIAFDLGVRQIEAGNAAPIVRNRKTGTTTAQWVGELQSAAKSQISLGRMEVSPHALSAKSDISNLLMLLNSGAAEQLITTDFAQQFALAIDRAILIGANSEAGPIGIVNTPGVKTAPLAVPTFDELVTFVREVDRSNALFGKLGWAISVNKLEAIEKILDQANQPLVRRAVDGGTIDRLRGYKFRTTTQMPASGANAAIFGAFDQAIFFRWFGGMILKSTDTSDDAIDFNLTRVAAVMYGDVGIEQPTAFCVASS